MDCGAFACGLALVLLVCGIGAAFWADVLFGMKCYHLHEEYLASLEE